MVLETTKAVFHLYRVASQLRKRERGREKDIRQRKETHRKQREAKRESRETKRKEKEGKREREKKTHSLARDNV